MRAEGARKVAEARALPAPAAADRAGFISKDGKAATYDLLDRIKAKEVKLEDLKEDELPAELKKIDDEVKAIVQEAADFAQQSPEPPESELWTDVLVPSEAVGKEAR